MCHAKLFQMMYSLIDTKIVGSILGEEALAAVGSVSILYNLLTCGSSLSKLHTCFT